MNHMTDLENAPWNREERDEDEYEREQEMKRDEYADERE
jgi:hypothetical protein